MNQCVQNENDSCSQFDELHNKLDRLDHAIRGNGEPGINIRLDRLEQNAIRHARWMWLIAGAGVTSLVNILFSLLRG
ncbi:MAG TPA: hypothetical protein DCM28_19000 [Phycisphaerales bacterium]|nr:hypothetical protein [Phycisphaerales bacterium]HCD30805.1 hypothetical protein [Phycisphaerales bacterium]|tara:strand:+ start:726 stop:956 length:231 start_codon:yes stop_codon:yes gene_type:complete